MDNPFLPTIEQLALWAVALTPILMAVIEGLKAFFNLEGKAAMILAVIVNGLGGLAVVIVYIMPEAAQWVGIAAFLLTMMTAPIGGYGLLKRFAGKKE